MDVFFFGPSSGQLFGAYHPPTRPNRQEGIVLCNPYGQEYMRAHRSLRRLAINLSGQGFSVLRFDYRGTGDSAASLEDVTTDDWQQDIQHAIQELIDIAAVPKVPLLGLRLGALLAGSVAASNPRATRLVMWDPIVHGQEYIDELRADIASATPSRSKFIAPDGTMHFNGFSMSAEFQQQLAGLDLIGAVKSSPMSIAQVVSHESDAFRELQDRLDGSPLFTYKLAPAPHDWNYVDHVGGILWPQPIVEAIEDFFRPSITPDV